jgi:hypothetical protein
VPVAGLGRVRFGRWGEVFGDDVADPTGASRTPGRCARYRRRSPITDQITCLDIRRSQRLVESIRTCRLTCADEIFGRCSVRRRTAAAVRIGPASADQSSVPAQQRVQRNFTIHAQQPGEQPGQRGEHRTVGPVQLGPGFCRRSTANSWRSTNSSASVEADERASSALQPARRMKIR